MFSSFPEASRKSRRYRDNVITIDLLPVCVASILGDQNRGYERRQNGDGDVRQFDEALGCRLRIIFRHRKHGAILRSPGPNDSFCRSRQHMQKLVTFAEIHFDRAPAISRNLIYNSLVGLQHLEKRTRLVCHSSRLEESRE